MNKFYRVHTIFVTILVFLASWLNAQENNYYWYFTVVDDNAPVGIYTSLKLDRQDHPHISYGRVNGYIGGLKYAYFNGTGWDIVQLDEVGEYTSIALDADQLPHISYSSFQYDLRYAYFDREKWNIQILDNIGGIGFDTSIAIDSLNRVHIAYWIEYGLNESPVELNLLYAYYDGQNWSTHTPIDTVVPNGKWSDIALDRDLRPHVSYLRQSYGDLKYAYLNQDGIWKIEQLPKGPSFYFQGYCNSITIDSRGTVHISFVEFSTPKHTLKYAVGNYGNFTIETVDSILVDEFVSRTSIQVDRYDQPFIAYQDSLLGALKLAYKKNGKWFIEVVDSAGSVGQYCSMDLTQDDLPMIAYYDNTHAVLKLARASRSKPVDTDQDGLPDYLELARGTDRLDKDTDDDGLSDGEEDLNRNGLVEAYETDPRSADSDGDGIPDGVELGRTQGVPANGEIKGTNLSVFQPDLDPLTTTDPLERDSDGDGLMDGEEDVNYNGKVDRGESDPLNIDSDGDGLIDGAEVARGISPVDLDSDDDGLMDSEEDANRNNSTDFGETDPALWDTDQDGLPDGLEQGVISPVVSSNDSGFILGTRLDRFVADSDPSTTTDPTVADTDRDGVLDGIEDASMNGKVDPGETDPQNSDSDGDEINDGLELRLRSDPLDLDSDDDGIADGMEDLNKNGIVDSDETSPLLADTDRDGISDGIEMGVQIPISDPDGDGPLKATNLKDFKPDFDPGQNSDPLKWDTDGDGLSDGEEDKNRNGAVDNTETNFLEVDSDKDGLADGDEVFFGSDPLNPDDFLPLKRLIRFSFENATLDGWSIVDQGNSGGPSDWTIVDKVLLQTANIWGGGQDSLSKILKPGTFLKLNEFVISDFRLTLEMASMDDDEIGVMFRVMNDSNYYRFSMNKELKYSRMIAVENGKPTLLAENDFDYQKGKFYSLKLYVVKDFIRLYLDNVAIFTLTDQRFQKGTIALYTWKNSGAAFRNIEIFGEDYITNITNFIQDFSILPKSTKVTIIWRIRKSPLIHSIQILKIGKGVQKNVVLYSLDKLRERSTDLYIAGQEEDLIESGEWTYKLKVFGKDGGLLQEKTTKALRFTPPNQFSLKGPFPNPSNDRVTFLFNAPHEVWTRLQVFDSLGRLVLATKPQRRAPGSHVVSWEGRKENGRRLSAGIYFVKFIVTSIDNFSRVIYETTKKVVIGIQ